MKLTFSLPTFLSALCVTFASLFSTLSFPAPQASLSPLPMNEQDLNHLGAATLLKARTKIARLENLHQTSSPSSPTSPPNFATSFRTYDELRLGLMNSLHIFHLVDLLYPQEKMKTAGQKWNLKIREFMTKYVDGNTLIYTNLKKAAGQLSHSKLTPEESYFIKETLADFTRNGRELPPHDQDRWVQLKDTIAALGAEFESNIQDSSEQLPFTKEELRGIPEDFIKGLKKDQQGRYLIGTDYPTHYQLLNNASISATRKKAHELFKNRAYPKNFDVLSKLLQARAKLARLMNKQNYAELDLTGEMAESPQKVMSFLREISEKLRDKIASERATLSQNLPDGVQLTHDHKIKDYDYSYTLKAYREKFFAVDMNLISEYFPFQKTLRGLLDIYEKVFNIELTPLKDRPRWHQEVKLVEVKQKGKILGLIYMDLFPRPGKYNHARVLSLNPSMLKSATYNPGTMVIMANFSKPLGNKPALFKFSEVTTFFHEFGHALHGIFAQSSLSFLSSTEMSMTYGLPVKTDFVELPSMMFSKWLSDKQTLKNLSSHYQTGAPLPDHLLDNLFASQKLGQAIKLKRMVALSLFSLKLHQSSDQTQIGPDFIHQLFVTTMNEHNSFVDYNIGHMPTNFLHLYSYGAKYYSYLWSDVLASDVFSLFQAAPEITSPTLGAHFKKSLLDLGGARPPMELVETFLGRKTNADAFFRNLE